MLARAISTEAELEETKSRGLDMYRQNTLLTQQVQALTVRGKETEAQLKDGQARDSRRDAPPAPAQRRQEPEGRRASLKDDLDDFIPF